MMDQATTSEFAKLASREMKLAHDSDVLRPEMVKRFKGIAAAKDFSISDQAIDKIFARMAEE